jgi:hypothetical protein
LAPDADPDTGESRVDRLAERLAPLVEDGTLTAEQVEAVAEFIAAELPVPERPRRRAVAGHLLHHTADFLDIGGRELREELAGGDSIARIAEAEGSTGRALVEYLVEDVEDHLFAAVERGRLDSDRAADLLEEAERRITEFVFDTPQPSGRDGEGA